MKRFEVRRFLPEDVDGLNPYVVILQTQRSGKMDTVIVAPLQIARRKPIADFEVPVSVGENSYLILVQELTATPRFEIGGVVADVDAFAWRISLALDHLLFGP